jgi:hypothetical protein
MQAWCIHVCRYASPGVHLLVWDGMCAMPREAGTFEVSYLPKVLVERWQGACWSCCLDEHAV